MTSTFQKFISQNRTKVGCTSEHLELLDLLQALEMWRSNGTREADFALAGAIKAFEVARIRRNAA
jgi:hypothetical protein